ncbi:MAG: protein-L-isoaspartate O-methyltransferase family protein [Burkholderiales bacterium]|nr:protein-L-isoaspartate O-methyltransferase [Pseudomonadota bacterium]
MDFEQARFNMVEQQIRTWQVLDQQVLDLMSMLPREDFVPPALRDLAFADLQIPLGRGAAMMPPKLEARILQTLEIAAGDRVLEIGTGSGYLTALLAHLAKHVYSVEIVPELSESAGRKLAARGIDNVTLEVGDAARGWIRHAPYDVIVLTASTGILPASMQDMLAPGGRLFAIVGTAPAMVAKLLTRVTDNAFRTADLFETCVPPLKNALQPERFIF